jgi:hypothetical protein
MRHNDSPELDEITIGDDEVAALPGDDPNRVADDSHDVPDDDEIGEFADDENEE